MNAIVSCNQVCKSFAKQRVINHLDMSIYPGQMVALLGVNGAGKTTSMNMMLGLETPDSGEILLAGQSPQSSKARKHIGITPQNSNFPEGLQVKEIIEFVATHYEKPRDTASIMEKFALTKYQYTMTNILSGGQKRRLSLALAFVGNPKLMFLDEPTTGLDLQSRQQVWTSIREAIDDGCTIVLSTHYLEEAEALANRVLILHDGNIKADGTVAEIKALADVSKVCFRCAKRPILDGALDMKYENQQCTIYTQDPDNLIREIVQANIPFSELDVIRASLETAFLKLSNIQQSREEVHD